MALTADKDKPLKIDDPVSVSVDCRFLYGAPAAELDGEAEMKIVADPLAFATLPGFRFGLTGEKVQETIVPLTIGKTDAQGKTTATGKIEKIQAGTLPLKANISVSIFEPGGRATRDEISLPVRPRDSYVGMRPRFDGYVQESTPAQFEIALVDNTGKRIARPGMKWELVVVLSTLYGAGPYGIVFTFYGARRISRDKFVEFVEFLEDNRLLAIKEFGEKDGRKNYSLK